MKRLNKRRYRRAFQNHNNIRCGKSRCISTGSTYNSRKGFKMESFLKFCRKVKDGTAMVASILMGATAIALLLQVTSRTLFNYSFSWEEEFARYAVIWVSLLMASVLVHDRQLINVDFLDKYWPQKAKKYRDLIIRFLFCGLFIFMTIEGFNQAYYAINMTTTAMDISWFWPYLAIPVGSLLMLVQMAFIAISDLKMASNRNAIDSNSS
jgi:TRAP-type transport system small permease protein